MLSKREIEMGADAAIQAMRWILFTRDAGLHVGELRQKFIELFGPEVDAEVQRRLFRSPDHVPAQHSEEP